MTTSKRSDADLSRLPALPRDKTGPVFKAPWEAQAFAITLELHRKGVFTWREWADALADELANASERGHPDDSTHYYEHWLSALEKLVAAKKVVPVAEMACRIEEWDNAARKTPHGKPIELPRR